MIVQNLWISFRFFSLFLGACKNWINREHVFDLHASKIYVHKNLLFLHVSGLQQFLSKFRNKKEINQPYFHKFIFFYFMYCIPTISCLL